MKNKIQLINFTETIEKGLFCKTSSIFTLHNPVTCNVYDGLGQFVPTT